MLGLFGRSKKKELELTKDTPDESCWMLYMSAGKLCAVLVKDAAAYKEREEYYMVDEDKNPLQFPNKSEAVAWLFDNVKLGLIDDEYKLMPKYNPNHYLK
ncbi:hypothetical protein FT641_18355 [Bacillus paranthracis]|uniref:hypothetical protein n=1 Tax=Bacillus paranthracis TaxID=2026186 RepID=UPI00187A4DCA|nr:hypothetical protein [Bacillus paranthracis]MBE7114474.1 hypothetical protein [Bacillus paranthracis]MBE7154652.1 hypothetical protein [Bacillus paranthracis]